MWFKLKAFSLILSHLLISISLVHAYECYDTGNFITNSTYGKNRDLILASLPANVSSKGGFFTDSIGEDSDKVYALGMCRGDSTADICYTCLSSAIPNLTDGCPNQKEALSWGANPPCLVRYADHSFFGILELEPTATYNNSANIASNITEFDMVWENLMDSVVRKASNGSSVLKYATGEADFAVSKKMYALMQCTPDLSDKDCDSCLRESVIKYQSCCHGKQGGFVQKPNCWLRSELFPFYKSLAALPSPPPQSVNTTLTKEGGGSSSQTLVIIVVPIVIFVAVFVIVAVIFLLKRRIRD